MFKRGMAAGMMVVIAGVALAQARQPEKPKDTTPAAAPKEAKKEPRKISVGDKPPEITVKKFVKGEPVTGFEKGKVYVVEFWATWCPPCKKSIPHLTELQKKFAGKATIVGVSVWERDQSKVEPFVKEWDDRMQYTVAMDDVPAAKDDEKAPPKGKMATSWMEAADQNGIPAAFIINQDTKIAWIGNPLQPTNGDTLSIDDALQRVVDGKYDINAAAKAYAAAQEEDRKAEEKAKAEQGKTEPAINNYRTAMQGQDADALIKATNELMAINPEQFGGAAGQTYLTLFTKMKNQDKANAFANGLLTGPQKDNAQAINAVSWTILDNAAITKRDVDTALKLATRAVELTKEKDGTIIDTLALAYFQKGDAKKALELQQKALKEIPPGAPDDMVTEMKDRLKKYEDAAKK